MKKGVTINLDKPRTLRYGMNALAKIEDITGKSILALDLNRVGIKDLLAIVYGGLYHEDNTLTPEKVGDLIGVMRDIVTDKDGFINKVIANIEEVVKNRQSETSTEEIDAKIISIQNEMIGLVRDMTVANTAEISAKTQEMLGEIERLKHVKETTIAEGLALERDLSRMDNLREMLNSDELFDKFNADIFRRVVDKVLIDGKTATFVLCDAVRITRPIIGVENE